MIGNFRKVYKEWKQEHKHFFSFHSVKRTEFEKAKDSLIQYLRIKNISLLEIDILLSYLTYYWDLVQIVMSFLFGLFFGNLIVNCFDNVWVNLLASSVIFFLLILSTRKTIWRGAEIAATSEISFISIVLQNFKTLYYEDLKAGNKLIGLCDLKMVEIPVNAELIYEEKMNNPKYYRNAFCITILKNKQSYEYIWFSNRNYSVLSNRTRKEFMKLCREQIGKNWDNIVVEEFTFKKLEPIE